MFRRRRRSRTEELADAIGAGARRVAEEVQERLDDVRDALPGQLDRVGAQVQLAEARARSGLISANARTRRRLLAARADLVRRLDPAPPPRRWARRVLGIGLLLAAAGAIAWAFGRRDRDRDEDRPQTGTVAPGITAPQATEAAGATGAAGAQPRARRAPRPSPRPRPRPRPAAHPIRPTPPGGAKLAPGPAPRNGKP